MVLNFNCMLVLLSMCRNIISLIRSNLNVCIPDVYYMIVVVLNFSHQFDFYFPLFLIMIISIRHWNLKIKNLKNFKPNKSLNESYKYSWQRGMQGMHGRNPYPNNKTSNCKLPRLTEVLFTFRLTRLPCWLTEVLCGLTGIACMPCCPV